MTVDVVPPEERKGYLGVLTGVKGGHDLDARCLAAMGVVSGRLHPAERYRRTRAGHALAQPRIGVGDDAAYLAEHSTTRP
jgi:hypothetical protein